MVSALAAKRLIRAGIAASVALFTALPAFGQWTDVGSTRAATERETVVRSDDAAELRIWLDDQDALRMQFTLAPGLIALAPESCVTIQVDSNALENLSAPHFECSTDGASVQLLLTHVENKQIDSPMVRNLMNGRRANLRYRLTRAGYGSSQFTLRGSKQALKEALGDGIEIVGD